MVLMLCAANVTVRLKSSGLVLSLRPRNFPMGLWRPFAVFVVCQIHYFFTLWDSGLAGRVRGSRRLLLQNEKSGVRTIIEAARKSFFKRYCIFSCALRKKKSLSANVIEREYRGNSTSI